MPCSPHGRLQDRGSFITSVALSGKIPCFLLNIVVFFSFRYPFVCPKQVSPCAVLIKNNLDRSASERETGSLAGCFSRLFYRMFKYPAVSDLCKGRPNSLLNTKSFPSFRCHACPEVLEIGRNHVDVAVNFIANEHGRGPCFLLRYCRGPL